MYRLCLICGSKIEPDELPCPKKGCAHNGGHMIVRVASGEGYHQAEYVGITECFWWWQPLSEWHKLKG